jgi:signal transduction histidine kinase
MNITLLEVPSDLLEAANLTPEEARLALALGLFHTGRLSHDQAKDCSGDPSRFEASLFPDGAQLDLNDFLDWGSHDLKTPLNMVIGFSKVVLKGIDGPINETQQTDLTSVYDNGQKLLNLISMLVDIARLNKGSVHLSTEQADFGELLEKTAVRWKAQNPSRELATDLRLPPPVAPWPDRQDRQAQVDTPTLQLDSARMKQALGGLLTYAALHVAVGGTVHLTASEDTHRVTVSIESRGSRNPAMPELDLVMLRFINRALIRLHGGDLAETGNPEGGVTIRFWLPRLVA